MSKRRLLFGYGTMRRGLPMQYSQPPENAEFIGHGQTPGRLVIVGERWAGLIPPEDEDDWVRGDVFRLHPPEHHSPDDFIAWHYDILDRRECYYPGAVRHSNYIRRDAKVLMDNGNILETTAYHLNLEHREDFITDHVGSGDWTDWIEEKGW